jgi:16S rRNA (uracil1498-N3)-methyltransferase
MSDRFFCPDAATGDRFRLEGDEARHLSRVLRLGAGATVEVFDGRGHATLAEVLAAGKDVVELRRIGQALPDRALPISITLATAVPKGDRFDWLVEKATELGVARLIPLRTERSVVDPGRSKLERLRRAVVEASKQCGRNRLMEIGAPVEWTEFLRDEPLNPRLIAHPGGLRFAGWPVPSPATTVVLAVGPEGGFSKDEVASAVDAGWCVVGLGSTLLRVETACLTGCARLLALAETNTERADG